MFRSPRQALGYMFAAERGPGYARVRLDGTPRSTGRSTWDHVAIAAMLRGPIEKGCCGVQAGSELDAEVRAWATNPGHPRTPEVRKVEIAMRRQLRNAGMKIEREAVPPMERVEFEDAEGVRRSHTAEAVRR